MAKKKDTGMLVVIAIVVAVLASIPKQAWILLGLVAVGWFAYSVLLKKAPVKELEPPRRNKKSGAAALSKKARTSFVELPVSVDSSGTKEPLQEFRIPRAPKGVGPAVWYAQDQVATVSGTEIPGGMIYVGSSLKTLLGNDPCLIDPGLSVASRGSYTERQFGYWPSYSEISPAARRAYLSWLAGGRQDPAADIGYVFLFFYGLERRVLIDAQRDENARNEFPHIAAELRRLLGVYGNQSGSFRRYAGELLDWVALANHPAKLYERPLPGLPLSHELPYYLRLVLGQAAVDGVPVSASLALAWVRHNPEISLRTPATRCAKEFERLFEQIYADAHGAGIVLPKNRTKLKLVYRPASSGFRGVGELSLTFGEIPDITAVTAPTKKLQVVVEKATQALEAYSRHLGKNPEAAGTPEASFLLPPAFWPEPVSAAVNELRNRVAAGPQSQGFGEFLASLGISQTVTRDRVLGVVRALEASGIGFEPDVLAGSRVPKPDDAVVLFGSTAEDPVLRGTAPYQSAMLTVQLASSLSLADGEFSEMEMAHLKAEVNSWIHLSVAHQARLVAHLHLLKASPVSLASLKKKIEPMDQVAKKAVAAFMATLAQADGVISPEEVRFLEKIYKALGVEPAQVFSDIHAAGTGRGASTPKVADIEKSGFVLDADRIATLQRDTEKVTALLAGIFTEEQPVLVADAAEESESPVNGLLGLDESHSAFLRILLSRPSWARSELQDVAADLDLMLDGALEQVNEAAFDAHDVPVSEGDDPVEINVEVLEKIES